MGNVDRAVVLAAIEAGGYGVDAAPGAANAIVCSAPSIKWKGEKVPRNAAGGSHSPWPHSVGERQTEEISFDVDLRGFGAAYSASNLPEISPLMRACGFGETVDATPGSEKVTYAPVSVGYESCTIYVYDDGFLYKALGCRGDVEIMGEVGKHGVAKFKLQALYTAPADQTLITPTYQDTTVMPPVLLAAGLTLGGYSPVFSKLEMKAGNQMGKRPDANAASGIKEIIINGREPSGSLDPEAVALATKNFFTEWMNGTLQAIAATLGSVQYNRVKFSVPKAQYESVEPGDRDKQRTFSLPFSCKRDTGDDELVITFD